MKVDHIMNMSFGSNTYLVSEGGETLVIDPGVGASFIMEKLPSGELVGIVLTHCHFDHILGLAELARETRAPVMMGARDAGGLSDPTINLSGLLDLPLDFVEPDRLLHEGDEIGFGDKNLVVMETPGHTPGSLCFLIPDERMIFTGDTLFFDSVGRTDLPGGSTESLQKSLARIAGLGDDWMVMPGHGPGGFLWEIKRENPYL